MTEPLFTVAPLLREDGVVQVGMVLSIRLENCGLKGQGLEILGEFVARPAACYMIHRKPWQRRGSIDSDF